MGDLFGVSRRYGGEAVSNPVVDDEAVARRQRLCPGGGGALVREMEAEKMESWMGHGCEQEQCVGLGDIIGGVFGGVIIWGCVFVRVFFGRTQRELVFSAFYFGLSF
jgi:hypothetical protein